jgi:nifR3 family TIM-barrel protein
MTIYSKLPKPFLSLAPMEDVTDSVFRQIIAECGAPDLFYTEFTSVDGLFSKGRNAVIKRLQFCNKEKPIIAQIWGKIPENYYKAGELLKEMGFDGIDINMGCPVRKVIKNGCCSALIQNPTLASEIIKATQEGSNGLPVSVKTRIGFNKIVTEEWIGFLLSHNLDLLTVHGRTTSQQSDGENNWEEINKARELRDQVAPQTPIAGNGDVKSLSEAHLIATKYKLDGIMIGRGIFHNPFVFTQSKHIDQLSARERVDLLLKHARLFVATWGEKRNFQVLKRFFKIYVNNFEGAVELRAKLMETNSLGEVEVVCKSVTIE